MSGLGLLLPGFQFNFPLRVLAADLEHGVEPADHDFVSQEKELSETIFAVERGRVVSLAVVSDLFPIKVFRVVLSVLEEQAQSVQIIQVINVLTSERHAEAVDETEIEEPFEKRNYIGAGGVEDVTDEESVDEAKAGDRSENAVADRGQMIETVASSRG